MTRTPHTTIDIDWLAAVAARAGREILDVYGRDGDVAFDTKADDSPLTEADRRANSVILEALRAEFPGIPVISEESAQTPHEERAGWREFWLVDPLDGTKEFLKRNGEFTVNIALVVGDAPVVGIVHQPVGGVSYWTLGDGASHRREADGTDTAIRKGPHYSTLDTVRVVGSRSHGSPEVVAFVDQLKSEGRHVEFTAAGSSLKLCLVAEGRADVYPRLGPTMEWDTAAAQAVAGQAGCKVLALPEREPLRYNKPSLLNPWFVVE